jgi:hypothetical protein
MYICIINNGSKTREREEKKATTKQKLHPKEIFTFFFIWQAIVRGRLFLQRAFFLYTHASHNAYLANSCLLPIENYPALC